MRCGIQRPHDSVTPSPDTISLAMISTEKIPRFKPRTTPKLLRETPSLVLPIALNPLITGSRTDVPDGWHNACLQRFTDVTKLPHTRENREES